MARFGDLSSRLHLSHTRGGMGLQRPRLRPLSGRRLSSAGEARNPRWCRSQASKRERAVLDVERIAALPIFFKAMENPKGTIPTRSSLGQPTQVIQPYEFGDDASKATCLWLWNLPLLRVDPAMRYPGRIVMHNGKRVERWSNQTDSGQNALSPSDDRWNDRSRTFQGIAKAFVRNWGHLVPCQSPLRLDKVRQRDLEDLA